MGILNDLLLRVTDAKNELESGSMVREVLIVRESEIMDKQYEQLFAGKAGTGEDIRPYYSEDLKPSGWFKSKESALRYAEWKRSLSYPVQANRNDDAPNLFINGKFHSELGAEFGTESMTIDGKTDYAKRIVNKYGLGQFGLSEEKWAEIFEGGALADLMNKLISVICL